MNTTWLTAGSTGSKPAAAVGAVRSARKRSRRRAAVLKVRAAARQPGAADAVGAGAADR